MVKAELTHNPYLVETKVKFNGKEPKINSLIEKYQNEKLQAWLCRVPKLFYNEMNGYDFDFDFSGTRTDYEGVITAFLDTGLLVEIEERSGSKVTIRKTNGIVEIQDEQTYRDRPSDVRIFFKNELKSAAEKSRDLGILLAWLEMTPNRRFDNQAFREAATELFDEDYTYLLIQGSNIDTSAVELSDVTIETITTLTDLPNDLTNTPILFYLDEQTKPRFRDFFENILARKDVIAEQLFFLVHPELNTGQIERTIQDLGIKQPQVVKSIDDSLIQKFFEVYPMTEYIGNSIQLLQTETQRITTLLTQENDASRIQNYEVRREIARLETILDYLKQTNDAFSQKDNLEITDRFSEAKFTLAEKIQSWRKKKASIHNDLDANRAAVEYEHDLNHYFAEYVATIIRIFSSEKARITEYFFELYQTAVYEDHFRIQYDNHFDIANYYLNDLVPEFLNFRKEQLVEQPEEFFGLKKFFGEKQTEPRPLVNEITYSLSSWRYKANELILPEATRIIEAVAESLKQDYETIATSYQEHLTQLIARHTNEKEAIAATLSDEEQKLQIDNDWLAQFKEKVNEIARG